VGSPSSSEESTRPDPTYARSTYPSGLVARLPDRDVDLPADTSCWTAPRNCRRALLESGGTVPDLGQQDAIDFWFARPGWTFDATFRRFGEDCPRATNVEAVSTGDQWFRRTPADQAGQYVVDLGGYGPEGMVSTRFFWTTTADGPVDLPVGAVGLFPGSLGGGSYALEVKVDDLGFQPARSELSGSVEVTVTAADGRERTLAAPLIASSLECGERGSRGSFYYQKEWVEDIAVLGRAPLDLGVTLTVRGMTYVGRATCDAVTSRTSPYSPLTFTPPLPAAGVD
jgi:hypothetical protein